MKRSFILIKGIRASCFLFRVFFRRSLMILFIVDSKRERYMTSYFSYKVCVAYQAVARKASEYQ